jgi:hypothetical protein
MTITINIGVDTITTQLVGNIGKCGGEGCATQRGGKKVNPRNFFFPT